MNTNNNSNKKPSPERSMTLFYLIAILIILILNFMVIPSIQERRIRNVDYGTFMNMTNDKEISQVEIQDNQIVFTDKNGNINFYK